MSARGRECLGIFGEARQCRVKRQYCDIDLKGESTVSLVNHTRVAIQVGPEDVVAGFIPVNKKTVDILGGTRGRRSDN